MGKIYESLKDLMKPSRVYERQQAQSRREREARERHYRDDCVATTIKQLEYISDPKSDHRLDSRVRTAQQMIEHGAKSLVDLAGFKTQKEALEYLMQQDRVRQLYQATLDLVAASAQEEGARLQNLLRSQAKEGAKLLEPEKK